MKKKQKCYIYTRVSTAVQVDGYSLDVQDMLKDLLADTLQGMLEAEMDDHLYFRKR